MKVLTQNIDRCMECIYCNLNLKTMIHSCDQTDDVIKNVWSNIPDFCPLENLEIKKNNK